METKQYLRFSSTDTKRLISTFCNFFGKAPFDSRKTVVKAATLAFACRFWNSRPATFIAFFGMHITSWVSWMKQTKTYFFVCFYLKCPSRMYLKLPMKSYLIQLKANKLFSQLKVTFYLKADSRVGWPNNVLNVLELFSA